MDVLTQWIYLPIEREAVDGRAGNNVRDDCWHTPRLEGCTMDVTLSNRSFY